MRLYVFISLFLIGTNANRYQAQDDGLSKIFGDGSEYIPKGYEPVSKPGLEDLKALPKCGEGVQKGKKVCVVYYRCDPITKTVTPEDINTTGEGIFDIRENTNECDHFLDTCCNLPDDGKLPTTALPPQPPIIPPVVKPSYCGIRNKDGIDFKITGQTNEAEYGEFPWMVAILRTIYNPQDDESEFLCGASLIAPSVVMTGAHCVEKYKDNLHKIKIRAGEWDALSQKERLPFQERAVKQIIVHPHFNSETIVNDIALLVLEHALSQAENIGTICMPEDEYIFSSKDCFASGWGKREFGNKKRYSSILKKLHLPIVPKYECQCNLRDTRLGSHFELDESFVCAGGDDIDTCTGDGGSPLVCPDPTHPWRYLQVGIVAWGIGCGKPGVPGVYANVPHFRSWIDKQMSVLGLSTKPYIL